MHPFGIPGAIQGTVGVEAFQSEKDAMVLRRVPMSPISEAQRTIGQGFVAVFLRGLVCIYSPWSAVRVPFFDVLRPPT
jgi:hypothetical protein